MKPRAKLEEWYSRWRAQGIKSSATSWYILSVCEALTLKECGIHLASLCQGRSLLYDKVEQELFHTCSCTFLHLFFFGGEGLVPASCWGSSLSPGPIAGTAEITTKPQDPIQRTRQPSCPSKSISKLCILRMLFEYRSYL